MSDNLLICPACTNSTAGRCPAHSTFSSVVPTSYTIGYAKPLTSTTMICACGSQLAEISQTLGEIMALLLRLQPDQQQVFEERERVLAIIEAFCTHEMNGCEHEFLAYAIRHPVSDEITFDPLEVIE